MADAATPLASALAQPKFWTLDRLADALGDGPRGTTEITRISTDTRSVAPGSCFLALRGENFDAHNFLADAVASGARALIVNDARPATLKTTTPSATETKRLPGELLIAFSVPLGGASFV